MTMQTVNSTLIQAIGYNPLTEQLSVTMQKNAGTTYVFRGVGRNVMDAWEYTYCVACII